MLTSYFVTELIKEKKINLTEQAQKLGLPFQMLEKKALKLASLGLNITHIKNTIYCSCDNINNISFNNLKHIHIPIINNAQAIAKSLHIDNKYLKLFTIDYHIYDQKSINKNWHAECCKNILMCFILPKAQLILPLSILISFALRQYLTKYIKNTKIFLKWPNNIIVNDAKLCSISLENHPNKNFWILNINLNVHKNNNQEDESSNITLSDLTILELNREKILQEIAHIVYNIYTDKNALIWLEKKTLAEYHYYDYLINKPLSVNTEKGYIEGFGRGIDAYGNYLIENLDDKIIKIKNYSAILKIGKLLCI